jgi:hypothetical protein
MNEGMKGWRKEETKEMDGLFVKMKKKKKKKQG